MEYISEFCKNNVQFQIVSDTFWQTRSNIDRFRILIITYMLFVIKFYYFHCNNLIEPMIIFWHGLHAYFGIFPTSNVKSTLAKIRKDSKEPK